MDKAETEMAFRYCRIPNHIWTDGTMRGLYRDRHVDDDPFSEEPKPDPSVSSAIGVYFYLVSCPDNTIAGLFSLNIEAMSAHLRMSRPDIGAAIKRLEDAGLVMFDAPTRSIMICHQIKNECPSGKNQMAGIMNCIERGNYGQLGKIRAEEVARIEENQGDQYPLDTPSIPLAYPSDTPSIPLAGGIDTHRNTESESEIRSRNQKAVTEILKPEEMISHEIVPDQAADPATQAKQEEGEKPKKSRRDNKAKAMAYLEAVRAYWEQYGEEIKAEVPDRDYADLIPEVEAWCIAKPSGASKKSHDGKHIRVFLKGWLRRMPRVKQSDMPANREAWAHHAMRLNQAVKDAWEAHKADLRKRYPQRDYGVVLQSVTVWILNNHEKTTRHEATETGALRLIEGFLSRANVIPSWGLETITEDEKKEMTKGQRYAELMIYHVNPEQANRDLDTVKRGDAQGGPDFLTGLDLEEYQIAHRRIRLAHDRHDNHGYPLPFTREGQLENEAPPIDDEYERHRLGFLEEMRKMSETKRM